ncbi:MAG: ATP-binding protein [Spirochaetota bacterium]|nr:ATP-binding protein [Spirochaetota bacterium]
MNLPDSYFLESYKNKDIVLQLKAWAALIFNFSLLFVVTIMGIYFVARGTTDPAILLPFASGVFTSIISLILLRRGKFQIAANISFASVQIALWIVMFFEKGQILQRLDSITLVAASLVYTPLLFIERRRGIWFYYTANMLLLIIFTLYSRFYLGLQRWEAIEYFMDSSLALTFVAVISYLIFSIHKLGIINAKKAEEKIQRQYEELSATNEELEAMNEELAAINEELEQTQQELLVSNINLQKETARLQAILVSIADGIVVTDENGIITSINAAALKLFGLHNDVVGKQFKEHCTIYNAKTGTPYHDPVTQVLTSGKPVSLYRNAIIRNNSNIYHTHIVCTPLYVANRIDGCIVDIRDMTDVVRYEEELIKTAKYESLSIFAGGIAHDFNNMLGAILGNISIIEQLSPNNEKVLKASERAQKAIMKARDLTTQLLAFSKGGAPVKTSTSLVNIIKDTAEFVLSGSPIQCNVVIEDDLHNALVDPTQISQVIHNIILNARQAIKGQGTITITANNVTLNNSELPIKGNFIAISIHDTGEGIPADIMPYIFDPFFTTRDGGHGLGLSIAYSIVKKHDGHITVNSSKDGTLFTIYLPVAPHDETNVQKETDSYCTPSQSHILIMDDDALIAESLNEMLSLQGCTAVTVSTGDDAIKAFADAIKQNKPFAVAILDLTIKGGKGGVEIVTELRNRIPSCKFIATTGYTNEPIIANYRDYGFDAILRKPFTLNELTQILSQLTKEN